MGEGFRIIFVNFHIPLVLLLKNEYTKSKKIRFSYFCTKCKGDDTMLAELRPKAQITIPKEIIVKLGLSEGDKLDIFEKDGSICIMPVAVYPKKYLNELREEISDVKAKLASGEQPVFDSVDALFDKLESE